MIVQSASLSMSASHAQASRRRERVDIEVFSPSAAAPAQPSHRAGGRATASSQLAQSQRAEQGRCERVCDDNGDLTPKWALLRSIVEALTGRLLDVFDAAELQAATDDPAPRLEQGPPPAPQRFGGGMRVTRSIEYYEAEAMRFQATGQITTRDGKTIAFDLELDMQRSVLERSQSEIVWGDVPRMKDPLVINFDGQAATLTSDRYDFDLDADGVSESIPGLSAGRAFLVLDKNANGRVDDGRELLGAISGNAYADLAALDNDGNGFIDQGDAAFHSLGLWRPEQDQINALDSQQVAALSTANVASEFRLDDEQDQQQGQLRASSIYLKQDGTVSTTQQLDFVV